jgi:hypothetical protein
MVLELEREWSHSPEQEPGMALGLEMESSCHNLTA